MKYLFLIQARTGSTRFPKKILEKVYDDKTLIDLVIGRLFKSKNINRDNLWILTTDSSIDNILVDYLSNSSINFFRGDENNVYNRFISFLYSLTNKPDYIFRICSDNPFIEPSFIDQMIEFVETDKNKYDYVSFSDYKSTPAILTHYGFFCELIDCNTFMSSSNEIATKYDTEHVTPYFYKYNNFKVKYLKMPDLLNKEYYRFTVDTKEDFEIIKFILTKIDINNFNYIDIINTVKNDENLINRMSDIIKRNIK